MEYSYSEISDRNKNIKLLIYSVTSMSLEHDMFSFTYGNCKSRENSSLVTAVQRLLWGDGNVFRSWPEYIREKQLIKLYTECLCTSPYRNYILVLKKEAQRELLWENPPIDALPRRLGIRSFQHFHCQQANCGPHWPLFYILGIVLVALVFLSILTPVWEVYRTGIYHSW